MPENIFAYTDTEITTEIYDKIINNLGGHVFGSNKKVGIYEGVISNGEKTIWPWLELDDVFAELHEKEIEQIVAYFGRPIKSSFNIILSRAENSRELLVPFFKRLREETNFIIVGFCACYIYRIDDLQPEHIPHIDVEYTTGWRPLAEVKRSTLKLYE